MKMPVFWVLSSLNALMMEAVQTSETSVNSYQPTRYYNPEDGHLRSHRRENLRSHLGGQWAVRVGLEPFMAEGH
jgi:hypothetical protein